MPRRAIDPTAAAKSVIAATVPDTERTDVEDGGARGRQRERRQHAEEVRAPGDAVQHAHAERGVRMSQASNPLRVRPGHERGRATIDRAGVALARRARTGSEPRGRSPISAAPTSRSLQAERTSIGGSSSRSRTPSSATTTTPDA